MVDVKQSIKTAETNILQYRQQRAIPLPSTEPDARLAEEGFPKKVSKAFQKTADKLNCVVWSRVPGRACTTLIDEGYNLKPFYVHGKSCNWGPMAGFVCQLPALNKSGTSKMAYNLKEHIESLVWLIATQRTERDQNIVADSLFLPLVISEARKQELLDSDFLPNHSVINPGLICGIAQDSDETVAVEYLLKKQAAPSTLWNVYHRNIYIKDAPGAGYTTYLSINGNKFSVEQADANNAKNAISASYNESIQASINPENIDATTSNSINRALQELGIVPANKPIKRFYPINGVQSPYLAYRDNANRYKNAVSGDYDLFAVWPFTPNASFEMTTRISELESKLNSDPSEPEDSQNLFIPVESKKNALEITKSRNVFIEFIGTYQELDEKEDPEVGNINDLVSITAQTLNSLVQAIYQGQPDGGQFPNRAFHSDEGGRPGVDEIEYPIAFFVPRSQWSRLKQHDIKQQNVLKNTAFVVENHVEFLSLVKLLRRRFYVFLHDGWFMHWMCLAAGKAAITEQTNNVALPDKARRYLEARIREIDGLDNAALRDIESLLQELLLSTSLPATAALTKAFQDVTENFLAIATYPQSPDAAERKDLISPLEIKQPE